MRSHNTRPGVGVSRDVLPVTAESPRLMVDGLIRLLHKPPHWWRSRSAPVFRPYSGAAAKAQRHFSCPYHPAQTGPRRLRSFRPSSCSVPAGLAIRWQQVRLEQFCCHWALLWCWCHLRLFHPLGMVQGGRCHDSLFHDLQANRLDQLRGLWFPNGHAVGGIVLSPHLLPGD